MLLPSHGATGVERIENMGLTLVNNGESMIIDDVAFESAAAEMGLDWDQEIVGAQIPVEGSYAPQWVYIPALMMLGSIAYIQIRRRKLRLEGETVAA